MESRRTTRTKERPEPGPTLPHLFKSPPEPEGPDIRELALRSKFSQRRGLSPS